MYIYSVGNHYFEDLKTLILCSLFFHDDQYLECVLKEFKSQCKEQILEDGMHFELSPMYHKIILEDMLRVAWGLRIVKKPDQEIEGYLQPMIDVSFSLEEGLERVPLFNDSGNNVSKSLKALMRTAQYRFHIVPHYKSRFPVSGYYIFKQNEWKLIVDAGQPGPTYIPGHAHCDAMSFELFKDGKPVIVNCGTYAYQCEEREFFRSTAAHNTVMVKGVEQSQCWGTFRLAKRSNVRVLSVTDRSIQMELKDQSGNRIRRTINLDYEKFLFEDRTEGKCLTSFVHSMFPVEITEDGSSLYIINIGKCQANLWIKLLEYVKSAMLSLCDCGLADDDQTILLMVYLKHKDNCMLFPSTWNMQLYDYCSGDNKLKLSNIDFQKHNKCNLKKFIKARKYNLSLLRYSLRQYKIMSIKGKK